MDKHAHSFYLSELPLVKSELRFERFSRERRKFQQLLSQKRYVIGHLQCDVNTVKRNLIGHRECDVNTVKPKVEHRTYLLRRRVLDDSG